MSVVTLLAGILVLAGAMALAIARVFMMPYRESSGCYTLACPDGLYAGIYVEPVPR